MTIVYIFLATIVGFVIGRKTASSFGAQTPAEQQEAREAAGRALNERTEERKERILEMARDAKIRHEELKACQLEAERRGISRRDVEDLLGVSERTALKYIDELEKEEKLVQIDLGKDTYYRLST